MTKIQTILSLFLFLVIVFSMDMIFGNPLRETFSGRLGKRVGIPGTSNIGIDGVIGGDMGSQLNYKPVIRTNTLNGNMIYSGSGFLGAKSPYPKGDDQPLFFGFSN
jgi:hypothetical protein